MGGSFYSTSKAFNSRVANNVYTKSTDQIFEQNIKRKIHESMDPKNIKIREARDSENHPNSVPIILALDVTGSMLRIPEHLIKDGLPHMMGGIIQKGVPDPALLFLAIGDHECDRCPLQVGQFESGDAELDTWLSRTYLEGGGGGNAGESYLLAWYFAANHTETDAWDKRKQKGFLFTVGDEPCLNYLPQNVLKELMTEAKVQGTFDADSLLSAAKERYEVYHLHVTHSSGAQRSLGEWKERLGDNCIDVPNYEDVPKIIADIVCKNDHPITISKEDPTGGDASPEKTDILL